MTKLIVVLTSVTVLLALGCGGGGASAGNFTPVGNLATARALRIRII